MSGAITEQLLGQFVHHGSFCGLRLHGGKFANYGEEGGIDDSSVEQEGTENFEHARFIGGVESWSVVSGRGAN